MNINKDIRLLMALGLFVCVVYFAGLFFLRETFADTIASMNKQNLSLSLSITPFLPLLISLSERNQEQRRKRRSSEQQGRVDPIKWEKFDWRFPQGAIA